MTVGLPTSRRAFVQGGLATAVASTMPTSLASSRISRGELIAAYHPTAPWREVGEAIARELHAYMNAPRYWSAREILRRVEQRRAAHLLGGHLPPDLLPA